MITLSIAQVVRLQEKVIERTGGTSGIRDEALLDWALMSPFQTYDGVELYPSTSAKIARITYSIIKNHPFNDGNKRIGTYVMMVLLELNQIEIDMGDYEIISIGKGLSSGTINDEQLHELLLRNMRKQTGTDLFLHEEEGVYEVKPANNYQGLNVE